MNASMTLSGEDRRYILDGLISRLYRENRDSLQMISPTRAAGIFDISPQTLVELEDLPRLPITPKVIRYNMADLRAWERKHKRLG